MLDTLRRLMATRPFRILSIDGGGIRGLVPARALVEIEQIARRPIHAMFDLVAGTSTGGILALALTMPDATGAPAWSAESLLDLYERQGPQIFARSGAYRIGSANALRRSKYKATGIDKVLARYFGDTPISKALTDVMVPAYDIEERCRYWFKSRKARLDESDDVAMADAARATSAAPTYFPPALVARKLRKRALVDGGVFANNPAVAAYADARDAYQRADIVVLSLGTGELTRQIEYEKARRWGRAGWVWSILDIVFDGVADEADNSMRKILGNRDYLRLQLTLDGASDSLDDASAANVQRLKVQADAMVYHHKSALTAFVGRL
jgi:patatin-like phospholipase/acyl hydrolase